MVQTTPTQTVNEYGYGVTKSVETGLSPGQTAGEVGGVNVVRPAEVDTSTVYTPGVGNTSVMIEGGATIKPGTITTVKRDQYGNVIGVRQTSQSGNLIFERKAVTGEGSVQSGLPPNVSQQYVAIETQRINMPLYRGLIQTPGSGRTPRYETSYDYESPFGKGLIKQEDFPGKQVQFPNTRINYNRTDISELASYPIYKGASVVSRRLTSGLEWGIDVTPLPQPLKEIGKGFGGMFTGLPEYFASGVSGMELAAREPRMFKSNIVPAFKSFGGGIVAQATERPFYTAGQVVGIVAMARGASGKGAKTPTIEKVSIEPRGLAITERFQSPAPLTRIQSKTIKAVDLSLEFRKPIFPETEGTPLPRNLFPYGSSYASKITYPKVSKFELIGKNIVHEKIWDKKPISLKEYFSPITRQRFIQEGDIFESQKVFGGRSFRKGEIDPWAKVPTMRQSAEAKGTLLKRTVIQPEFKEISIAGETELKYGKQSLVAKLEEPKTIKKTTQVQKQVYNTDSILKTRSKIITIPIMKAITKILPVTVTKQKQNIITSQKAIQIPKFKTIYTPELITSQISKQGTITQPIYRSITQQKSAFQQISKTVTNLRSIQRSIEIQIPLLKLKKIQKTSLNSAHLLKIKRKKPKGFGKFPEISRIASPKQIWRGFRI